ncbi:hypothetical protein LSAT2_015307 [Lamellibrachia satsuma]|nr:hypothetical protein LSAT2_015307 [Lamellibrachia satsuma]
MTNRSGDFRVTQIMSTNCEDEWAKPVDGVLMQPDSVNCQDIRKLTGSSRTPPYTIKLDLRDGRPENYTSVPSQRGRREFRGPTSRDEFLMATAIRVVFHGQPLKRRESHCARNIRIYKVKHRNV